MIDEPVEPILIVEILFEDVDELESDIDCTKEEAPEDDERQQPEGFEKELKKVDSFDSPADLRFDLNKSKKFKVNQQLPITKLYVENIEDRHQQNHQIKGQQINQIPFEQDGRSYVLIIVVNPFGSPPHKHHVDQRDKHHRVFAQLVKRNIVGEFVVEIGEDEDDEEVGEEVEVDGEEGEEVPDELRC